MSRPVNPALVNKIGERLGYDPDGNPIVIAIPRACSKCPDDAKYGEFDGTIWYCLFHWLLAKYE